MWLPNTTWVTLSTPAGPDPAWHSVAVQQIDNFSLNNVDIALDKPQDESPWAAGYHIDFNWPDRRGWLDAPSGGTAVRQAYVALRTPIGNGIDWKVGVFRTTSSVTKATPTVLNPNYTRSIGYRC